MWNDPNWGFMCEFQGYDLPLGLPIAEVQTAYRMVSDALRSCSPRVVKQELARLRALTSSREQGQEGLTMVMAAFAEELSRYPEDIVIDACRRWGRHKKWWPAFSELAEIMEEKITQRRELLKAIERACDHAFIEDLRR